MRVYRSNGLSRSIIRSSLYEDPTYEIYRTMDKGKKKKREHADISICREVHYDYIIGPPQKI